VYSTHNDNYNRKLCLVAHIYEATLRTEPGYNRDGWLFASIPHRYRSQSDQLSPVIHCFGWDWRLYHHDCWHVAR